jgi:putative ABC transport system permease protein
VPLTGRTWQRDFEAIGRAEQSPRVYHSFENWVTPQYFETLGTPLMLGRNFDIHDSANADHVALVNQSFAMHLFGSSNPIGRQLYEKGKKDPITIVGVVADARDRSLRTDAPPTLYRPIEQLPPSFPFVLTLNLEVWTSSPANNYRKPIEEIVRSLDSRATVNFHTFDSLIDSNLLYERLLTMLSVGFGLIGVFLSATGVYGLCAYSVARRTPEFGIRMALGASPNSILGMMFSEQIRLLAMALAAGLLISMALTRFLRAWLFGVSATDPLLYSLALFVIGALALLAAFLPARRAARLNPLTALRRE